MNRLYQSLLILSTLVSSWWGMMLIHEAGHVAAAVITGGTVREVELSPWEISRTDVRPNPSPLAVVAAGPVVGATLPLLLWLTGWYVASTVAPLLQFFAGFCLLTNGAYLAFGSLDGIGDAGDLLRHGADPWQLWLFGLVCMPAGLWCWHGLGESFGIGQHAPPVNQTLTIGTALFALLLCGCLLLYG